MVCCDITFCLFEYQITNLYTVRDINKDTLLMFNRFIHMIKVLARYKSYYIYSCFIWRTTFVLLEIPFILFKASHLAILHLFFYIETDSLENCLMLICHDLFHLCWIRRYNYCSGRVTSWHSSVFRYMYLINKRNVIIKATPWLLLYYPLAKRWVLVLRIVICRFARPTVRSFVRSCIRPFDRINKNRKTKIIDSNRDTHTNRDRQTNW